jgi:hypothetical protein
MHNPNVKVINTRKSCRVIVTNNSNKSDGKRTEESKVKVSLVQHNYIKRVGKCKLTKKFNQTALIHCLFAQTIKSHNKATVAITVFYLFCAATQL